MIAERINPKAVQEGMDLVLEGENILKTAHSKERIAGQFVDEGRFNDWKSKVMGFLKYYFGDDSSDYSDFMKECGSAWKPSVVSGLNIVKSCQNLIERTHDEINDKTVKTSNGSERKIFISHSSEDKAIVGEIIDLVEMVGVSADLIFCTSFQGYGVSLGDNFLERIKMELSGETVVLFVLSHNFYESAVCLCEMGATWVMTQKHVPILIPPLDFSDIKGVIPYTQGFKINESAKLNEFKNFLVKEFELVEPNSASWERKKTMFTKNIMGILNREALK